MRFLVLGAGATGGYFGGRLAEAGADVTFLVRAKRRLQLAQGGLVIESPKGDIRRPVETVTAEALGRSWDVIILTCKAYDLDEAIAAIAPAVGPSTLVLPVLNGLNHLDRLDAAFGAEKILGGLAQVTATLTADGVIRQLAPIHRLVFGPRCPAQAERVSQMAEIIGRAAFDSALSENVMQEMWEKHAFIATLAAATCLMRAAVCDIVAQPGGEAFILAIRDEAAAIAAACGHPLRPNAKAGGERLLTDAKSTMMASMARDLEAGSRTEADHILGDLISRGDAQGVRSPLLSVGYLHLRAAAARKAREQANG